MCCPFALLALIQGCPTGCEFLWSCISQYFMSSSPISPSQGKSSVKAEFVLWNCLSSVFFASKWRQCQQPVYMNGQPYTGPNLPLQLMGPGRQHHQWLPAHLPSWSNRALAALWQLDSQITSSCFDANAQNGLGLLLELSELTLFVLGDFIPQQEPYQIVKPWRE